MSKSNPQHYTKHGSSSPIDLITSYDLNFALGNVIKYVARHKEKEGRIDLIKALWYLLFELGFPKQEIEKITKRLERGKGNGTN